MHRLNCKPHNMTITIPYQAIIRAAVVEPDEHDGHVAAAALDDMLSEQPKDVREACLNLAFWLVSIRDEREQVTR